MRTLVEYGANSYGNKGEARAYKVSLVRLRTRKGARRIRVKFDFEHPAGGRGVGPARGSVESVELTIPTKTAEALAHGLLLSLADTTTRELAFTLRETSGQ